MHTFPWFPVFTTVYIALDRKQKHIPITTAGINLLKIRKQTLQRLIKE